MELVLLETNLEPVQDLDAFESLIWTDRLREQGDFEIIVPVESSIASYLTKNRYLSLKDSEHLMIIDNLGIHSDPETGNKLTITGPSIESILKRRIVWTQTIFANDFNFQDAIEQLLNENAINPTIAARKINLLEFEPSTDPIITTLTINTQVADITLYDAITNLCLSVGIGFKITLTNDGMFRFELYAGTNRSYDQFVNPFILFSSKEENIISTDYNETDALLKTVTLVTGEGEGTDRQSTAVEIAGGGGSDLERREMFTDARDISKTVDGGTLSDPDYLAQLAQRGTEELAKNVATQTFEGQVDTTHTYVYNQDYFMGDIVEIVDEYGHESKSQVTEFIYSQDSSGVKTYPTFSAIA